MLLGPEEMFFPFLKFLAKYSQTQFLPKNIFKKKKFSEPSFKKAEAFQKPE